MSENVEVVDKLGAAYSCGGEDLRAAFHEHLAPDVVLYTPAEGVTGEAVHGREEVIRFYMELRETFERDEIEAESLIEEGGYVVIALHSHAILKGTKMPLETRVGLSHRFTDDGKIAEVAYFRSFEEALVAVGLREPAVSEENVEIARRAIEAVQDAIERRDPRAAFDPRFFAAEFEWELPLPFEGRKVWAGREEAIEFQRLWTEQFDHLSMEVSGLIDAGDDRVVALMHQSATGKASGAPVEWDNGVVCELKDGRIIRATNYFTHADALEAAGLSE